MTDPLPGRACCAQLHRILAEGGWPPQGDVEHRLRLYVDLLVKWNKKINLVGPATVADAWRRHILDSGQLMRWISPKTRILADLGSGAGLPGLILAILGVPEVHLIESDARKCAFLQEAGARHRNQGNDPHLPYRKRA